MTICVILIFKCLLIQLIFNQDLTVLLVLAVFLARLVSGPICVVCKRVWVIFSVECLDRGILNDSVLTALNLKVVINVSVDAQIWLLRNRVLLFFYFLVCRTNFDLARFHFRSQPHAFQWGLCVRDLPRLLR